jgi:hypothetical protein
MGWHVGTSLPFEPDAVVLLGSAGIAPLVLFPWGSCRQSVRHAEVGFAPAIGIAIGDTPALIRLTGH